MVNKNYKNPNSFLNKKRFNALLIVLFFTIITIITSNLIDFKFLDIFKKFSSAFSRFISLYLPPNFEETNILFSALWDTFLISVSAGILGSIISFFFALLMSSKTTNTVFFGNLVRVIATIIRNIPSSIWAIILLISFWYGEFLALAVMTMGVIGSNARIFSDIFDEASSNTIEAIKAVGASQSQIISQSVVPDAWPSLISWTLYAIETNIRESTVIGMLAGGGIGHIINLHKNFRRFDELMAAVILIVILDLLFDKLSVYMRERI